MSDGWNEIRQLNMQDKIDSNTKRITELELELDSLSDSIISIIHRTDLLLEYATKIKDYMTEARKWEMNGQQKGL